MARSGGPSAHSFHRLQPCRRGRKINTWRRRCVCIEHQKPLEITFGSLYIVNPILILDSDPGEHKEDTQHQPCCCWGEIELAWVMESIPAAHQPIKSTSLQLIAHLLVKHCFAALPYIPTFQSRPKDCCARDIALPDTTLHRVPYAKWRIFCGWHANNLATTQQSAVSLIWQERGHNLPHSLVGCLINPCATPPGCYPSRTQCPPYTDL